MRIRWWVCFLLFLTWLVSYIDRSLMPMALPLIAQEFHLSPTVMGVVISAFFLGYAAMQIPGGMLADKIGARNSITLGVVSWSVFSLLTGTASTLANLIWVRILFGVCEGIHPPAAFKALSEWFPARERSRASGVVMSSNTLGPMIAPILFASLMGAFGWRTAFYLVSIPGFLVAIGVYWFLRNRPSEHPRMIGRELAEIGPGDTGAKTISFSELIRYRGLWQLFFVYVTWDVTWWGFQAWLPSYLLKARGFSLLNTGMLAALPYAAGFLGVLAAAYAADRTGRRKAVLVVILLGDALFMLLTATAATATMAIIFLTATGFFLPSIHGPFWSFLMDLLPSRVMGSASGLINTGGQIAGIGAPIVIGALIQWTGHYYAGFIFMAVSAAVSAVLAALLRVPSPERISLPGPAAAEVSSTGTRG